MGESSMTERRDRDKGHIMFWNPFSLRLLQIFSPVVKNKITTSMGEVPRWHKSGISFKKVGSHRWKDQFCVINTLDWLSVGSCSNSWHLYLDLIIQGDGIYFQYGDLMTLQTKGNRHMLRYWTILKLHLFNTVECADRFTDRDRVLSLNENNTLKGCRAEGSCRVAW